MNKSFILLIFIAIIFIGTTSSIFVVDEREKALVLQFGQVKSVKTDPGIKFKIPFIQNVVRYDDRILSLDTMPLEVTPLNRVDWSLSEPGIDLIILGLGANDMLRGIQPKETERN